MEKMKSFKAGTECTLKEPVFCPDFLRQWGDLQPSDQSLKSVLLNSLKLIKRGA